MKIDIEQNDLGTLCICALRYCFGRETYMPYLVQGIVRRLLPELSDKDIYVMREDCDFQERMRLYGDEKIDKPGWLKWRDALDAEKDGRPVERPVDLALHGSVIRAWCS